jgi:hypothetical protein
MRRSTLGTKAISLALNTCLVLSPLLYARDASYADDGIAWSAEFEPMVMRTYGYSPDVVSIAEGFVPDEGWQGGNPRATLTTRDNKLNNWNFAFRGEAEGMKNRWGFGVAGFQFNTQAKLSLSVDVEDVFESGYVDEPGDLFSYGYQSAAVVSFVNVEVEPFDSAMGLIRNEDGPFYFQDEEITGDTQQDFSARTRLDVWSTDIYGFRRLVDNETMNVDLRLGAKLGSLDVATDTDHSLMPCGEGCHVGMELDTSAKSKVLAGPYLAASGTARFGKVRVEGQLAQSVLFGDVDYRTAGTSYWEDPGDRDTYSRTIVDKSKSVTVPVTEADLKVLYDFNEFFSAGVGMYAGVWWNASVPTNSKPGSVELDGPFNSLEFEPTSANTDLGKEHIIFMGILTTMELRFFGP